MKKILALLLCFCLITVSVFAFSLDTDIKQRSMSLVGVADGTSRVSYFYNPASVYSYKQKSTFIISTGMADCHSFSGEKLVYKPQTYLQSIFISKRTSFSIDVDFNVTNEPKLVDNYYVYDLKRDVVFNFNASTGFYDFTFGVGMYGGSSMARSNVTNYLYQSILGKFDRIADSQFFNVKAGMLYNINNFNIGLTADKVLSYIGSEDTMTFKRAFDHVSFGFYWSGDKYSKRGRLKNWVMDAGFECLNIFNNEERTLALGGDFTLQLANEYSVSFRSGVSAPTMDFSATTQSFGVGVHLDMFDIGMNTVIPIGIYSGTKDPVAFNINLSFNK